MSVYTRPPVEIGAGESFAWRFESSDFDPADGWTLSYHFRGPEDVDLDGTVDGQGFELAFDLEEFTRAGGYAWEAVALNSGQGERCVVQSGRLTIRRNLEDATELGDQKSHAERMVERLEAAIEGTADANVLSYTIAGRSIERIPILELRSLLASYRREVEAERNLEALGKRKAPRTVRVGMP